MDIQYLKKFINEDMPHVKEIWVVGEEYFLKSVPNSEKIVLDEISENDTVQSEEETTTKKNKTKK